MIWIGTVFSIHEVAVTSHGLEPSVRENSARSSQNRGYVFATQPGSRIVIPSAFSPATANVKVGGTVTWTWNSGNTGHNVTYSSGPGTLPANSPTQAGGTTFSTTFTTVGTYAYHCTIHFGMEGTVKVLH